MYVYVTCMNVCIHIHIYIWIYIHVCIYICIHIHTCIYTHMYISCIYVSRYAHTCTYIYIYMHIYLSIYMCRYMCIHASSMLQIRAPTSRCGFQSNFRRSRKAGGPMSAQHISYMSHGQTYVKCDYVCRALFLSIANGRLLTTQFWSWLKLPTSPP